MTTIAAAIVALLTGFGAGLFVQRRQNRQRIDRLQEEGRKQAFTINSLVSTLYRQFSIVVEIDNDTGGVTVSPRADAPGSPKGRR